MQVPKNTWPAIRGLVPIRIRCLYGKWRKSTGKTTEEERDIPKETSLVNQSLYIDGFHQLKIQSPCRCCTHKLMAVPVAIPHIPPSRTHHRYDDCRTASWIPKASGRYRVHLAVSKGSSSSLILLLLLFVAPVGGGDTVVVSMVEGSATCVSIVWCLLSIFLCNLIVLIWWTHSIKFSLQR